MTGKNSYPPGSIMIHLLFVDDDPQAQRTLQLVLKEDYDVISAHTGRQGIDLTQRI